LQENCFVFVVVVVVVFNFILFIKQYIRHRLMLAYGIPLDDVKHDLFSGGSKMHSGRKHRHARRARVIFL